jgi:hypothetical protein
MPEKTPFHLLSGLTTLGQGHDTTGNGVGTWVPDYPLSYDLINIFSLSCRIQQAQVSSPLFGEGRQRSVDSAR